MVVLLFVVHVGRSGGGKKAEEAEGSSRSTHHITDEEPKKSIFGITLDLEIEDLEDISCVMPPLRFDHLTKSQKRKHGGQTRRNKQQTRLQN